MRRSILLLILFGLLTTSLTFVNAQTGSSSNRKSVSTTKYKSGKYARMRNYRRPNVKWSHNATTFSAQSPAVQATLSQYGLQGAIDLSARGTKPHLTAVDPYANAVNSADGLKPARPFWYSVDKDGLTILSIDDNRVIYYVAWPKEFVEFVVMPDGEYISIPVPQGGWEPVGMTVTYPTEEALASNSETPPTYAYVVMAHSGYRWESETDPAVLGPALRDPNLRDKIVPTTDPETESSMLLAVDISDPTFDPANAPFGPVISGAILGHNAGQPAYDPGVDTLYIPNMPSMSLPTGPVNLTSFVSLLAAPAPPASDPPSAGPPAPEMPIVNICGPEHPDEGLLAGEPYVWACGESGDGPAVWEFRNLPPWLFAHADKVTGQLDGLLYGIPPADGTWTAQARVTDYGDTEMGPQTSDWYTFTVTVSPTGVAAEAEAGFEAGVPGGQGIAGTGDCTPAATASAGSRVPAWIDVKAAYIGAVLKGCYVMGTAPISGEYYEFALPNFHFLYPFDREAVIFSGIAVGPYMFDPLPAGVGLSGLAWHQIEKLHDPSTEADILNGEFIGVEPFTGQLYRILPPQGSIEVSTVVAPPEIAVEVDEVAPEGAPLMNSLSSTRTDIGALLTGSQAVKFGDLVVEADRDIFVSAVQVSDPTGVDPTVTPIGGPAGSAIEKGALVKVNAGSASVIDLPGVQAYFLGLNSNLAPGIPGVEPGQIDNGVLWVTGKTTGNVAVVDTANGSVSQTLAVEGAATLGSVGVDTGIGFAYVSGESLGNVTIFGAGGTRWPRSPVIWSAATATFNVGAASSYTVTATGLPTPKLSYSGTLPQGLAFKDNGDGTATLSGTPGVGTDGDYTINFIASNNVSPDANQAFVLSIAAAPVFTSANTATFEVGIPTSFAVTLTGSPTLLTLWCAPANDPAGACEAPSWITVASEDGTNTIDGTAPAEAEGKSFTFTLWASTGVPPDATQLFTLIVVAPGTPYAPNVTTQPLSQTVGEGEVATFTAAASGYPIPTVQWEMSADGLGWSQIAGATGSTYTTPTTTFAMNGYRFRAVFTNTAGTAATISAVLTVTSPSSPAVTLNPFNQTVTAGQTATFAAAAGGSPTPTVQWETSTDYGMSWVAIPGATSTSYSTPTATLSMSGYQYRAVFTNTRGTATSSSATLTVIPAQSQPLVTTHPFSQTVTIGQAATFTAAASGNPFPTVQWQLSTSGSGWSNIAGATGTTYTTPSATLSMNGYQYRAAFTNTLGTVNSNAAVLTVNAAPVITTQPVNQSALVGQTATFTSAYTGNPRPSIQWQLSTNSGSSWANITGATSASYATAPVTAAMNSYQYRVVFSNALGNVTSNAAVLTVLEAPAFVSVNNATFTAGTTGSFAVIATGLPLPALSVWGTLPTGLTFADNRDGTAILAGTPAGGVYQLTFRAVNGVSPDAIQYFTLTVNAPQGIAPAITSANATTFTVGTAGSFTVNATGTPRPRLSGYGMPLGVTFTDNGNGTGTLAGTASAAGTTTFVIIATNGVSPDAIQYFTLTVNSSTPLPLAVQTSTLPAGRLNQSYSVALQATGGNSPYRWSLASGNLPRGLTLYQNGVISGTTTRSGTNNFTVRVTDSANRTATRSFTVRVSN